MAHAYIQVPCASMQYFSLPHGRWKTPINLELLYIQNDSFCVHGKCQQRANGMFVLDSTKYATVINRLTQSFFTIAFPVR